MNRLNSKRDGYKKQSVFFVHSIQLPDFKHLQRSLKGLSIKLMTTCLFFLKNFKRRKESSGSKYLFILLDISALKLTVISMKISAAQIAWASGMQ